MVINIFFAAAIICCVLTIILCRKYVLKAFNSIDSVLDGILTGKICTNTNSLSINNRRAQVSGVRASSNSRNQAIRCYLRISSKTTGEDRISKLTHKANRILDMYVFEVSKTTEEKETIQAFLSDMSHQMKTPLSGISMYADLLLEGNISPDEQQEFLYRIKSGTDKLQWMMDSLIKMSRLEVGAIQLAPLSENIRQTVLDAIGCVIAAAIKKNINITVLEFEDTLLYHDRKWTREAIVNVLENAVKYSETDDEIEVSVEPLPLYTKIIITDHGIGVQKSDWNMIFKRFYRGNNTKGNEGAGLGLYLAELIMERQGGYIMVDSIPGEFTSFSLFLQNCKKKS